MRVCTHLGQDAGSQLESLRKSSEPQNEMLKGTLDMMILRTLVGGDAHGHTIAKVIERTSEDLLV